MFENSRTNAKAKELKGYSTESESEAKARLETQGWTIPADAVYGEDRVFRMKEDTVEGDDDNKEGE